jgi:hypothetical protein
MNTIQIRQISIPLPSSWEELSERNLLFLAERFPLTPTRGFAWDFFIHLLNLPARPQLAWAFARNIILSKRLTRQHGKMLMDAAENNHHIEEDQLPEMDFFEQQLLMAIEELDNFKWIFEKYSIEKCLLPKIRLRFKTWYGPDWLLSNVTADEFDKADLFFLRFMQKKQEDDLHRLIACVWRPKAKKPSLDDIREPFSEFRIEHHAAQIAKWPKKYRIACLLVYAGMRMAFVEMPESKVVFSKPIKSADETAESTQWGKILLNLATEGSLGPLQQVKKSYIHDIVAKLALIKTQPTNHVPG